MAAPLHHWQQEGVQTSVAQPRGFGAQQDRSPRQQLDQYGYRPQAMPRTWEEDPGSKDRRWDMKLLELSPRRVHRRVLPELYSHDSSAMSEVLTPRAYEQTHQPRAPAPLQPNQSPRADVRGNPGFAGALGMTSEQANREKLGGLPFKEAQYLGVDMAAGMPSQQELLSARRADTQSRVTYTGPPKPLNAAPPSRDAEPSAIARIVMGEAASLESPKGAQFYGSIGASSAELSQLKEKHGKKYLEPPIPSTEPARPRGVKSVPELDDSYFGAPRTARENTGKRIVPVMDKNQRECSRFSGTIPRGIFEPIIRGNKPEDNRVPYTQARDGRREAIATHSPTRQQNMIHHVATAQRKIDHGYRHLV
jgi:hypothetical protein